MRYVVITTKHHDGFSMFDTKQTDYRITGPGVPFATNPRANIVKEIFAAFRKEGFGTGAYFSKPDWHSPDYWAPDWATPDRNVNYDTAKYPERWKRFKDFTFNQIEELDDRLRARWTSSGSTAAGSGPRRWPSSPPGHFVKQPNNRISTCRKIAAMARRHQPGLIVVDRTVTGRYENYRTPEQEIPEKPLPYVLGDVHDHGRLLVLRPDDSYKSTNRLIHLLVDIVSKGGNFLLNIGPNPEGEFAPEALNRLREIGDWMKVNAEAIYETRPIAPYKEAKICFTALPDGTVYAIYLADEDEAAPPGQAHAHFDRARERERSPHARRPGKRPMGKGRQGRPVDSPAEAPSKSRPAATPGSSRFKAARRRKATGS